MNLLSKLSGKFQSILIIKQTLGLNGGVDLYLNRSNLMIRVENFILKNNCPHRSSPNFTSNDRSSLYLTYNNSKDGNFYEEYFQD
jgi:hypothetical protein